MRKKPIGWDVDERGGVRPLRRRPRALAAAASSRRPRPQLIERVDREKARDELARWGKRFGDVLVAPIEVVDAIIRRLGGLPRALLIGGALYYVTTRNGRNRRR
ncbi:MAG: hypothetical protein ACTHU0_39210 [Kofleriaceae bacterium]